MTKTLIHQKPLTNFLERLNAVFNWRFDQVKRGEKIDFSKDDGQALYADTINAIIKKISEIKIEFPEKISRCNLFNMALEPEWQKKFSRNFYKLFIDRLKCDEFSTSPHLKFNRSNLEGNHSGADLCYAEGFAVAFLFMLSRAELELKKDQSCSLNGEEFLELFSHLNSITIGKSEEIQYNNNKVKAGHFASISTHQERAKVRSQYGTSFYHINGDGGIENFFEPDFNHKACFEDYYQSYQKKLSSGANAQDSLCELIDILGTDVHLCIDGNGRTAILSAWFLAISQNQSFIIAIDPYFSHPSIFAEAKIWTENFMKNPDLTALTDISEPYFREALQDIRSEAAQYQESSKYQKQSQSKFIPIDENCANNSLHFLKLLLHHWSGAEEILYNSATKLDQTLYISENRDGNFILDNKPQEDCDEDMVQKFNLRYINLAIENNAEAINATQDTAAINSKIGLYLMREVVKLPKQSLTAEDKAIINIVLRYKEKIIHAEEIAEFNNLEEKYQRPSLISSHPNNPSAMIAATNTKSTPTLP